MASSSLARSTIFPLAQEEERLRGAGGIGSNPIWGELNELLVIEATNDNAQIEITHMRHFYVLCRVVSCFGRKLRTEKNSTGMRILNALAVIYARSGRPTSGAKIESI